MKTLLQLLFIPVLCSSQIINISGIVTDTSGVPIPDAVVQLEKAGLKAITKDNGQFALSGNNSAIKKMILTPENDFSLKIFNGNKLSFSLLQRTTINIKTYSGLGKVVSLVNKTLDAGNHTLSLPICGTGVYFYSIKLNSTKLVFKMLSINKGISESTIGPIHQLNRLSKQSELTSLINDVIKVTKEKYLNRRIPISNSDSSSIFITMKSQDAGTVTDFDGNVYHAIWIGNQVWTVENIRTTKLNDGVPLTKITDSAEWANNNTAAVPAYCYHNNMVNKDSIKKYGALYNWYAVGTGKLAPAGWHIPDTTDWRILNSYLSANGYNYDNSIDDYKTAKSLAAKTDWWSSTIVGVIGNDLTANNSSGFSALPVGDRDYDGHFFRIGSNAYWWSSTERDTTFAYYRGLSWEDRDFGWASANKGFGVTLRLVRN